MYSLMLFGTYSWGDERALSIVGPIWLTGILEGKELTYFISSWTLSRTSVHPPLSKILTGAFQLVMSYFGFGDYPVPIRVQSSIFFAFTCVATYVLGERIGGQKTGLLSWLLFIAQPFLQPVDPSVALSSLDITCIFFSLCSIIIILRPEGTIKQFILAGLFFGLASLSKYVPLAVFPPLVLVWLLYRMQGKKKILERFTVFLSSGILVQFLGNPLLWSAKTFNFMLSWQTRQDNTVLRWVSNDSPVLQAILGDADLNRSVVRWVCWLLSFPTELFLNYYVVMITFPILIYASLRGVKLSRETILVFLWFALTFLFMEVHLKHFSYYDMLLFPPLSVICSRVLTDDVFLTSIRQDTKWIVSECTSIISWGKGTDQPEIGTRVCSGNLMKSDERRMDMIS